MSESNATYTQIHIQLIFAVKFRDALIQTNWKEELYKYVTGIIQNNNHKLICINGMPDHIHILIGLRPNQSISSLVNEIKSNSSKFINEKRFLPFRFEWQKGYGAFSYGKSQLSDVINYINNQEKHHHKKSFREEYLDFLNKFEVNYNEDYVFNDLI
jgi:REP element-mobilizing transposase RayT